MVSKIILIIIVTFSTNALNLLGKTDTSAVQTISVADFEKKIRALDSLNEKVKILELKANNYESLFSMQGGLYQIVITILIFVFGFGVWRYITTQIEKVRIENDEKLFDVRAAMSMTLGDVNEIIRKDAYKSGDYLVSFSLSLSSAKYFNDAINIPIGKNSDQNIKGLTGKGLFMLEIADKVLKENILIGSFDKEIADQYVDYSIMLDILAKSTNSLISKKSESILAILKDYVDKKQLLNR